VVVPPKERRVDYGDGMRGMAGRLTTVDQRLLDRLGAVQSGVLDHALPRLSHAANHGRLWFGVAGVLVLTGRSDARHAATRGLVSLGVASGIANVVAKQVVRRVRPTADRVPPVRWLRRAPVTTSFPSGHSASAAAFATGAAIEMPVLAVPLGGLAGAVAISRVVTGAHYPSDVVIGVLLGAGVGAATLGWRRPRR
jgi:membrane-associated phospholipid phosphatase